MLGEMIDEFGTILRAIVSQGGAKKRGGSLKSRTINDYMLGRGKLGQDRSRRAYEVVEDRVSEEELMMLSGLTGKGHDEWNAC